MAFNWYPVSELTGGADGALDALDGSYLKDGDRAYCIMADAVHWFILDEDSGQAADPPFVVEPVENAESMRWIWVPTYAPLIAQSRDVPSTAPTVTNSTNSMAIGPGHTIEDSDESAIMGGEDNILYNASECFMGGGSDNRISDDYNGAAIGGDGNTLFDNSESAAIGGGANQLVECSDCVILGGSDNELLDSDQSAIIAGGYNVIFYSDYAVILSGEYNAISSSNEAAILGGHGNQIYPIGGSGGDNAVVVGGRYAVAGLSHQEAFGAGYFSTKGDAQRSTITRKAETINGTGTALSNALVIEGRKTWKFDIHVVARQTGGTAGTVGDSAFWEITGGIKATDGTAAVGTLTMDSLPADGDSVDIADETIYFKDPSTPDLDAYQVKIGSGVADTLSNLKDKAEQFFPWLSSEIQTGPDRLIITAKDPGSAGNDISFDQSASGITMDGAGTLGGTTYGVDKTISLVGTPQGAGAPSANDCDTGAATWAVAVSANESEQALGLSFTGEADKEIHWVIKINLVEVG